MRAKWFFCAFKLGFPQLIWKASWFFKPNLDLEKFTITLLKKLFQTVLNWKSSMKTQPWSAKLHYNLFYVSWNKKTFFNEIEYDKLYPSGSVPACIYGTYKMHKFSSSDSFPKLRPMVSSIGTFNHNLACFLCGLLSPLVPNDYSYKDTFSFVSQI